MKKLLEKWKGIVTLVLVSLSLYSCKDDDNSGISTESIIGVWEGIKADSWSIVPAAEATEGWWGQRPDKDSQYGTDISDYRVEFTADMFYRVYTYNEYTDKQWFRIIEAKSKALGIDLSDPDSIVSIANKLLGNIVSDSLKGFKETLEDTLDDNETIMIGESD